MRWCLPFPFLLAANVELLTQRWQMGCESAQEARALADQAKYPQAAQAYSEALNMGRKSVLALQEQEETPPKDTDDTIAARALDWLIQVYCDSCLIKLEHLQDADGARGDAWAACVFSQYQRTAPLDCMKQVCQVSKDPLGESQAVQQLLALPEKEWMQQGGTEEGREELTVRLNELEVILQQVYSDE